MNIEQEREAIKNVKTVYIIVQGIRIKVLKRVATEMLFSRKGWIIDQVYSNHIVLAHTDISDDF